MGANDGKKLIVRESFAMFFGGGKIFFVQLDGLYDNKALVMEKFERDMQTLKKPSAPSQMGLHLKDTVVDRDMAQSMLLQMNGPGQHMQKVAIVGLKWLDKRLFKRLIRDMDPPARYALDFFEDYEQAKIWLVK
jgi:hypothetical protein